MKAFMSGRRVTSSGLALLLYVVMCTQGWAHGVGESDAAFIAQGAGARVGPFLYLGAKHMVTGYDHLLFLFGVIFFLYRFREVALYVTLFAVGHSVTLLTGVLNEWQFNPWLIDAIIGLSVVYKAFDNMGGFQSVFGVQPDTRAAVLLFGLAHGFGLATKLHELELSAKGLVPNILAFNVGVELGQIVALSLILVVMTWWRAKAAFARQAFAANVLLMAAGFVLMEYQLAGYFLPGGA